MRFRTAASTLVAIAAVSATAFACGTPTIQERDPLLPQAITDPYAPEVAVQKLAKTPEQTTRVLVTVRVDELTAEAAKKQVGEALRQAGADRVEPVDEQPILIVEANAAQLRAALRTGQVARVRIDAPTKPRPN